ncbi:TPA: Dam family site-specific DNA-(adenine-N6)-methyltransferase [Klebsiella pneumoniae]|nr:Dam family site-specific DNA-(adenine-N6)-methyltransferase [Klebsiella pneumoniae]HBQ1007732.1 Dam family site-specific DNA-(adenine-N6)-methyltransferase [Klebsiella pneumoniae]HBQ1226913.1 Dam family site-specific DNA-(adenine-N6)-methyltransferase [Klebsiella pneumoniae]HBU6406159.1 Dam family site-specific DNA-(adenine-N6)-methyltransferase [Klebsiella pneumoniae]HBU6460617.1 Dam family site-specific DNA-(adenine-N6)-methyltransferase [Klebsiella pneumoniae]
MAVKSPLKWAGSKVRAMPELLKHLPAGKRLVEPFAGSGAVMMNTDYDSYLIADANPHLVNTYIMMTHHTDALLCELEILFSAGSVGTESQRGEFYYSMRTKLNDGGFVSAIEKAACFMYLNRHGYNGMCRYNLRGGFNVPYGKYKSPYFPAEEVNAFAEKGKRSSFVCADFSETLDLVLPGDVIYCDPPYNPESRKKSFTKYHTDDFNLTSQKQLAAMLVSLADRGYPVVASNSDTDLTHSQYGAGRFNLHKITVGRSVGAATGGSNTAPEIIAVSAHV